VTPDRWTDDRISDLSDRVNDLVSQIRTVAGLTTLVSVHDAKIDQLKDADEKLRATNREAMLELKATLTEFDAECEKKVEGINALIRELRRDANAMVDSLKAEVDKQEKTRTKREVESIRERKADRRWLIGTVFTAALVIIAAMSLLVDKL
jgi:DNA anti-recombination protein RmuC